MFCPRCKVEYRAGFTDCSDCHIPLVREPPAEKEMPDRTCPKCGKEYSSCEEECPDCRVDLLTKAPEGNEPACMICPKCRAEYQFRFRECSSCCVDLVSKTPGTEPAAEEPVLGDLVQAAVFDKDYQAQIVKSVLEGRGIRCVLENEFAANIMHYSSAVGGGIKLCVFQKDAEEALRIIGDMQRDPEGKFEEGETGALGQS